MGKSVENDRNAVSAAPYRDARVTVVTGEADGLGLSCPHDDTHTE